MNLAILVFPRKYILKISKIQFPWWRALLFLAVVGIIRGSLEGTWILWRAGDLHMALTQKAAMERYLLSAGPFLIANVVTVWVRWMMFAMIPFFMGRMLGGKGTYVEFLRVFVPAMAISVVTIIPDFIYGLTPFPTLQFSASPLYQPNFGIGQVLTSTWLIYFGILCGVLIHGLSLRDAALGGIGIITANVGLLVMAAMVFFRLPKVVHLPYFSVIEVSTLAFIITAVLGGALLFYIGRKMDHKKRLQIKGDIY